MKSFKVLTTLYCFAAALPAWGKSDAPEAPPEQPLVLSLEEVASREQNARYWRLQVTSPDRCACSQCSFEHNLQKKGNRFTLTVGKIVPPLDCLEPAAPAQMTLKLPMEEREYFLDINGESYRLQVSQEFAELKPLKTKLTRTEKRFYYRPIPNLVSLVCFRYRYACETGRKAKKDELCPRLFAAMKQIATPADTKTLVKRGISLDCTPEYLAKDQCRLYTFDGPTKQLQTLLDNSNSYRLINGLKSRCEPGEPPLYYRKFRTWDEQEVCC